MTREDFIDYMVELGWTEGCDEVGDRFAFIRFEGVTLEALPKLRTSSVSLSPTLSRDDFDVAQTYISGRSSRYAERSIILQTQIRDRLTVTCKEQVKAYCDQMIEWAHSQDMEQGLEALRGLPTDAKGAMPARHLAALAVHGDVETLTDYRDNFAGGNRLDFVPYIDRGYIGRAFEFAQQRTNNPSWLPTKPKVKL